MEQGTLVVVDDNKTNLQLLNAILSDEGYVVKTFTSGLEALESIKNETPDLILLDILMPEINGIETCQKIKMLPDAVDVPVIFISAIDNIDDKVKAFDAGGVDYITKPFQTEEVLARVNAHIKLYQLQNSLQVKNKELEESQQTILEQQHKIAVQSRFAIMGEVLNLIAHHWRQPLSVMSTLATNVLLQKQLGSLDDATIEETQQSIIEHAQGLSNVIDQFRDFFKPNTVSDTTLRTIFTKAIKYSSIIEKESEVALTTVENEALDTPFQSYENELIQVLVALISNAFEALHNHPVDEPKITLEGHCDDDEITITVSDNAGGIPVDKLDDIFLPYFSTKEKQVGTGLGLFMCKMVLERHCEGSITANNSETGAVFSITVPKSIKH